MVKLGLIIILQLIAPLSMALLKESWDEYNFTIKDFSIVSQRRNYIDKTLLIKEVLNTEKVMYITAPRKLGKSVNIDMLRKFLQIEVDAEWNEITNKTLTSNYELFTGLNIFMNDHVFFNKHFGKYPVLYIDYGFLCDINSFEGLLQQFKIVLRNAFLQHKYLLRVKSIWEDLSDMEYFIEYMGEESSKALDQDDIESGFDFLIEMMYRHFKKRVVVLIDDYDTIVNDAIFGNANHINDTILFFQRINNKLLTHKLLGKAFLSGVFGEMWVIFKPRIAEFQYSRYHKLSKYYGLTTSEIYELMVKHTDNAVERNQLYNFVVKHFKGYRVMGTTHEMYNLHSVLNYLVTKNLNLRKFQNTNSILIFECEEIRKHIINALQQRTLRIDISRPTTRDDIQNLNTIINRKCFNTTVSYRIVNAYLRFLFEHGYFTFFDKNTKTQTSIIAKIPNLEVELKLFQALQNSVFNIYNIDETTIDTLRIQINSVADSAMSYNVFNSICQTLQCVFIDSYYAPSNDNHMRNLLFTLLRTKFNHVHTEVYKGIEYADIVLNNNGVSFVIKTNFTDKLDKGSRDGEAKKLVDKLIEINFVDVLDKTAHDKVAYLGISFNNINRKISMCYSKFLRPGDNLSTVFTVTEYD